MLAGAAGLERWSAGWSPWSGATELAGGAAERSVGKLNGQSSGRAQLRTVLAQFRDAFVTGCARAVRVSRLPSLGGGWEAGCPFAADARPGWPRRLCTATGCLASMSPYGGWWAALHRGGLRLSDDPSAGALPAAQRLRIWRSSARRVWRQPPGRAPAAQAAQPSGLRRAAASPAQPLALENALLRLAAARSSERAAVGVRGVCELAELARHDVGGLLADIDGVVADAL